MGCATGSIAAYIPSATMPWNRQRIAHLYRRMGFGATNTQILAGISLSPSALVDQIINQAIAMPLPTPPIWYDWTRAPVNDYTDFGAQAYEHRIEWSRQWITDMISKGFREKMALFWHNHFVTQHGSYSCSAYLYEYHKLLQEYALGNFKIFTHKIGLTPAMLLFLNGNLNEKDNPNENYARELMELFTMGQNNGYTESDVVEMARALTGWVCTADECQPATFVSSRFDNTNKIIFGQTGNWHNVTNPSDPNNVVNLIFTQRAQQAATFICTKFYQFFVAHEPDPDIIAALASTFLSNNFEIVPVLRQLFKSQHFFDDANIGHLLKSPLELQVGLMHQLQINYDPSILNAIFYDAYELGQELFNPINVAGWEGHRTWINENTLTRRWQIGQYRINNANETTKNAWVQLAKDLSNNSSDPALVAQVLVDYILPKGLLNADEYESATDVFKGTIPDNYFEQGQWNLDWTSVPDQIQNLFYHLTKLPAFQLN